MDIQIHTTTNETSRNKPINRSTDQPIDRKNSTTYVPYFYRLVEAAGYYHVFVLIDTEHKVIVSTIFHQCITRHGIPQTNLRTVTKVVVTRNARGVHTHTHYL